MLLGRSIWKRHAGGWDRESFEVGPDAAAEAMSRLGEILLEGSPQKCVAVFEPEGMSHQTVETPNVSRSVFASLAKVRSEFPVVGSESLGWGIESPEPVQGGAFSTLMHAELTPGLTLVRDACIREGTRLEAAWPAFTAAVACIPSASPAAKARFLLILARDFVAVATCVVGKRSFKAWVGPMTERDWKAFAILIGDVDARSAPSMADPLLRRGGIAVIADGEPRGLCPLWDEINASGRVGAVVNMNSFATGLARIPRRHPANLVEAFPVQRNINGYFVGTISAGFSAAVVVGALAFGARQQVVSEGAAIRAKETFLRGQLATLNGNRSEMNQLRGEIPNDLGFIQISRHDALVELASTIPDALTLTSLVMRKDNGFDLEAVVVGTGFDPESLRQALERSGFRPDSRDGWAFNAAEGRLAVHGKLEAPQT